MDPQGTCHLVGCEGKGKHAPHGIGTPTPESYERQTNPICLGTVHLQHTELHGIRAVCSIDEVAWFEDQIEVVKPNDMARLVDDHKAACPNRRPR